MDDAQGKDGALTILKQLVREEFLSEEKLEKLSRFDFPEITIVIKETKIGQGLKFLPQTLTDLTNNLQTWLEELVETRKMEVRNKVAAVLEELHRWKGISHQ